MAEQGTWSPPDASTPPPLTEPPGPRHRPRGRPAFGLVVLFSVLLRVFRDFGDDVAFRYFGARGVVLTLLASPVAIIVWQMRNRRRREKQGGVESTPDQVVAQLADSGLGEPAFAEDGTLLGASLLVVNQRTKVLEVQTEYEVYGSSGQTLGTFRQIGQSGAKRILRFFTAFDQYFTHHFEILDPAGHPVLRLTRPRKLFRTKLHVFDGDNVYLGTIKQMNVFWKIRFEMLASNGQCVGHLRAQNVRAWDFNVYDWHERVVATVVKSWEGWARTAFSRADRYAVRIHMPLPDPLRPLTVAAALAADLALKQDARAFG